MDKLSRFCIEAHETDAETVAKGMKNGTIKTSASAKYFKMNFPLIRTQVEFAKWTAATVIHITTAIPIQIF